LYLILRIKIVAVNKKVIEFAMRRGRSPIRIPYTDHKNTPAANNKYIPKDKSLVCLVFMILMACGKNEIVVHVAANTPIRFNQFIIAQYNHYG
jgi:hypothetical protein